jgi:hypothetical protein
MIEAGLDPGRSVACLKELQAGTAGFFEQNLAQHAVGSGIIDDEYLHSLGVLALNK